MLHFNERQCPYWARQQYSHTRGTGGWLGVKRTKIKIHQSVIIVMVQIKKIKSRFYLRNWYKNNFLAHCFYYCVVRKFSRMNNWKCPDKTVNKTITAQILKNRDRNTPVSHHNNGIKKIKSRSYLRNWYRKTPFWHFVLIMYFPANVVFSFLLLRLFD